DVGAGKPWRCCVRIWFILGAQDFPCLADCVATARDSSQCTPPLGYQYRALSFPRFPLENFARHGGFFSHGRAAGSGGMDQHRHGLYWSSYALQCRDALWLALVYFQHAGGTSLASFDEPCAGRYEFRRECRDLGYYFRYVLQQERKIAAGLY